MSSILKKKAEEIRDEVKLRANSSKRVGGLLVEVIQQIESLAADNKILVDSLQLKSDNKSAYLSFDTIDGDNNKRSFKLNMPIVSESSTGVLTPEDFLFIRNGIKKIDSSFAALSFACNYVVGIVKNNGDIDTNYTNFHTKYTAIYPCIKGDIFQYKGKGNGSAVSYVLFKDGVAVSSAVLNSAKEFTNITIPDDVNGVMFASVEVISDSIIFEVKNVNFFLKEEDLLRIDSSINNLSKDLRTAQSGIDSLDKSVTNVTNYVAYDVSFIKITSGTGFINGTGGVSNSSAWAYKKTQKLRCKPGDVFRYKGHGEGQAVSYVYYKGDTIISSVVVSTVDKFVDVVIPDNVDGVMFASAKQTQDPSYVVLQVKGESISLTPANVQEIIDSNILVNQSMLTEELSKVKPSINGKTLIAFGDSITQGTYGGFTEFIKNGTGLGTLTNRGMGGSTTTYLVDAVTGFNMRYFNPPVARADIEEADLMTIQYGSNRDTALGDLKKDIPNISVEDISSYPYNYSNPNGTVTSATLDNEEDYFKKLFPNTFIGNMALSISYIKLKSPNCRIFLLTIPPRKNVVDYTEQINNIIREIGKYFGVPIIDTFYNAGLSFHNIAYWSYDGLHFNSKGNKLWGNYIANELVNRFYLTDIGD